MPPTLESVRAQYRETILEGMARGLWVMAYSRWVEELTPEERQEYAGVGVGMLERGVRSARGGEDWFAVAPDTPKAAAKAATELAKLYEAQNHDIVDLFVLAEEADMDGEMFELYETEGPSETQALDRSWKMSDAEEFGSSLAMMALGESIGWFDDHKQFELAQPHFECHFDGDELTWHGGTSDVREVSGRIGRIIVVNQDEADVWAHRYLFRFGGFTFAGVRYLLVYADGLDSAIDGLIDWVDANEPDSIMTAQVNARYQEAMNEGMSEDAAIESAETDMTRGGNAGEYIASEDWSVIGEDPSEENLLDFAKQKNPGKASKFDVPDVTNPAARAPRGGRVLIGPDPEDQGGTYNVSIGDRVRIVSTGQVGTLIDAPRGRRSSVATVRVGSRRDEAGELVTAPRTDLEPIAQNPAGLTSKGERMYQDIKRQYQAKHDPRAKEIASRTVLARAREGAPGLVKKGNPSPADKAKKARTAERTLERRQRAGFEPACDDPNCRGWDLFETDEGFGIQACDMCNAAAKKEGLPVLHDDEAKHLPAAAAALRRAVRGR